MTRDEVVENKKNLIKTNLSGIDLNNANLSYGNFSYTNLSYANLSHANLSHTNLFGANLSGADLHGANFVDANLEYASVFGANFVDANLECANLLGANLLGANLDDAKLDNAKLPNYMICPEEGSFIAWKKLVRSYIAKLMIPENAKRTSSLIGRKCRAEFALILEIKREEEQCSIGYSQYDGTKYTVGSIVKPDAYDNDIRVECSHGIHFFITKQEAVDY